MERVTGIEPATFCMASRRSSQLSYTRVGNPFSTSAITLLAESLRIARPNRRHERAWLIARNTVTWYSTADHRPKAVAASSVASPSA